MGVSGFLVFINIAIFVGAFLILTKAFHLRHRTSVRWLMLLLLSFCVISFATLNVYSQNHFATKVLFSRLRFLGLALLAPSWLLFISSNYRRWSWLWKKPILALIFLPSMITITFTLVPTFNDYILTNFSVIEVGGLRVLRFDVGRWFPFHFAWSLFLVGLSLALGFLLFRDGDRVKRRQIFLMMIGTVIAVLIDLYCVAAASPMRWVMLSGGMFLFSEFAIAYATFRYELLDPSSLAMEKVYLEFPDPVLVVDDRDILSSFNNASRDLFGLSEASLHRKITEVIPPARLQPGEIQHFTDQGQERFFDLIIDRLKAGDEYSGRILYYREVTFRKAAEIRLGQKLEFKARLMSLIAHDLAGNVHSQARISEELQQNVPDGMQEIANMLAESISSSKDLMSNLLAWSKTQEEGFNPVIRPFEMNALLEDTIEQVLSAARLKNLHLQLFSERSPLVVNADSEMIGSVVRNFLTNSIRASSPRQQIQVFLKTSESTVIVEVQDQGSGLSADQIHRILDSQWRYASFAGAKGYGIGLSLARRFIELHGGQMHISSVAGLETRVGFSLPL